MKTLSAVVMSLLSICVLASFFILQGCSQTSRDHLGTHPNAKNITIALVGDSTVTNKYGWGKAFANRFNEKVTTLNFAKSGRSSKSFYDEKHLSRVLDAKPDYILIQFGHNDCPGKGPHRQTDPATNFRDYIKIYIDSARRINAKPILVTPVTRRNFDKSGKIKTSLTPFSDAMKAVAKDCKVQLIDLHTASIAYHNKIGLQASMDFNPKEDDETHFNLKGAEAITDLIIEQLPQADKTLASYLK